MSGNINPMESIGTEKALAKSRNYGYTLEVFRPTLEELAKPTDLLESMPCLQDIAPIIWRMQGSGDIQGAVGLIIDTLRGFSEDKAHLGWYAEFMNALKTQGFTSLVKILGNSDNSIKDDSIFKNIITMFHEDIMKINPQDIMAYLVQEKAISDTNVRDISKITSRHVAMLELLWTLKMKSDKWFISLVRALYTADGGIHRKLAETMLPSIAKCEEDIDKAAELHRQAQDLFTSKLSESEAEHCRSHQFSFMEEGAEASLQAAAPSNLSVLERNCGTEDKFKCLETNLDSKPRAEGPILPASDTDRKITTLPPPVVRSSTGECLYELSKRNSRYISVSTYRGQPLINIREYDEEKNGELKQRKKGITLTLKEWENLKKALEYLDTDIGKITALNQNINYQLETVPLLRS